MCDSLGGNRFRKTKDLIFSCLFGVWGIEILWKEGKEKGEREERKKKKRKEKEHGDSLSRFVV